jgi:hypothetical protein
MVEAVVGEAEAAEAWGPAVLRSNDTIPVRTPLFARHSPVVTLLWSRLATTEAKGCADKGCAESSSRTKDGCILTIVRESRE